MDPMQTDMHSVANWLVCLFQRSITERDRHVLYLKHLCDRTQRSKQCARTARRLAIRRVCDLRGHIRLAVRLLVCAASTNRKGFVEERLPFQDIRRHRQAEGARVSPHNCATSRVLPHNVAIAQHAVQQTETHILVRS